MKRILFLAACFLLSPVLRAEEPKPPVPMPADGSDTMPPPVDINSLTPLPLPSGSTGDQKNEPAKPQEQAPAPTATSIPESPAAIPTASQMAPAAPTPQTRSISNPSTAVPTLEPTAPPLETEQAAGTVVSAGAISDYFPTMEGAQWTYEYLKPAEGQTAKGTFTVKCVSAKAMGNGTVRAVFETTEGGQQTRDRYSLYDNKVEHTAMGDQTFNGDFVFKLPAAGGAAFWTVTEKNGTAHKSKAVFGQAQVYQKTYPDCVVVTEKVLKGGKAANTVLYYYAKGTGLVAIEVYSPGMKLIQAKSVALVNGPGAP